MINNVVLFLSVTLMISSVNSANILGFFPTDTQSHYMMYGRLMRELAAKGHKVTVISMFPEKTSTKNMIEIKIIDPYIMPENDIDGLLQMSEFENEADIIKLCVETCRVVLNSPLIADILTQDNFDLYITEVFGTDCFLPIGHKLGIPTVGVVSSVIVPWVNDMLGNPDNPSYIVPYFIGYSQDMSFLQRLYNSAMYVATKIYYHTHSVIPSQKIVNKVFGDMPPLEELSQNYSIILANSHFTINQVRPSVPQLIEVGGMHIPKVLEKLPKELQDYLDKSKDGVVYFSLGSIVPIGTMTPTIIKDIIKVLGQLKENVLWRANSTELPRDLPSNIKVVNWMPQLEVLCHPNIRLFITHGGMLSMHEAIHCGVPMLGIPVFADQGLNLAVAKSKGAAEIIKYQDLNRKTLMKSLYNILTNKRYEETAKQISQAYKDRPLHPLDMAIYWIEYVLRNNGAYHLKSPSLNLSWYQYLLLDIILFVIVVNVGVLISLYLLGNYIYKKVKSYQYFRVILDKFRKRGKTLKIN